MNPYPPGFGAYVLAALPYAGMEALRIAGWCAAVVVPAAAGVWLLARARRLARPSTPGIRHLHRTAANADDRHAPVTRPMGAAPIGDLVISGEVERYAAHKAAAPTEAIEYCPWCHNLSPVPCPEDCECGGRPCGAAWCMAARRQDNTTRGNL